MKRIGLLLILSVLLYSCAGTKYTQKSTSNNHDYDFARVKSNNTSKSKDFDNLNQVDNPDVVLDYFKYNKSDEPVTESRFSLLDAVIDTATENIGVRYRSGGTTKSGFDCSGLVFTSFKKFDVKLPRSSYEMAQHVQKVTDSDVKRGDLIFFITNGGRRINHVGIVTEVKSDEVVFVHSSTQLGVIISSTKEPYYKKNYVKVGRVL